jgi:hypothetical protein
LFDIYEYVRVNRSLILKNEWKLTSFKSKLRIKINEPAKKEGKKEKVVGE